MIPPELMPVEGEIHRAYLTGFADRETTWRALKEDLGFTERDTELWFRHADEETAA